MRDPVAVFTPSPSKLITNEGEITKPFHIKANQLLSKIETPIGDVVFKLPELFPANFDYYYNRDVTILGHSQKTAIYASATNAWNGKFGSDNIRYLNYPFYTNYDFSSSSSTVRYQAYAHEMGSGSAPAFISDMSNNSFLQDINSMT